MIGKSLLGFLVLTLLYALAMAAFPGLSVSQNQNQTNYIKAEQYLYSDSAARPVVLVGTSLSARLVMDSLPDFYNLAFGGMSVTDGLAIVGRREEKPEMLLIETDLYYKAGSATFLEPLFNPINYQLKKYLTASRSDKQPIALATAGAIAGVKNIKKSTRETDAPKAEKEVSLKQRVFEDQRTVYATLPEAESVARELVRLQQQIGTLEKQGVKIAFVEIPINAELINSVRQKYAGRSFARLFRPTATRTYPIPFGISKPPMGCTWRQVKPSAIRGFCAPGTNIIN